MIYPERTMLISALMVQKQRRAKVLMLLRESRQKYETVLVISIFFTASVILKKKPVSLHNVLDKTLRVINFISPLS